MKLSDWAKKEGISYLTAYRWFKDGTLPVKAYQSDSGTIIVQDSSEIAETPMVSGTQNDAMSLFLRKTVEFSKTQSSVEDFAAFVLSNFSLKLLSTNDNPRYSRSKPKAEDIQKHFQKFIKPKGEKPKVNMLLLSEESDIDQFLDQASKSDDVQQILEQDHVEKLDGYTHIGESFKKFKESTESMVDSQNTISQAHYTNSIDHAFSTSSSHSELENGFFKPTQKELESASKNINVDAQKSRGRGRRKISK
jgi:hypothetical protein